MTEFQLTITRRQLDPEYRQKWAEYEKVMEARNKQQYYSDPPSLEPPQAYISESVLSVTVDEPTFAAIRKAALETL